MEKMALLFSSAELADIVLARHVGRRFSAHHPWNEVVRSLAQIPEKGSIRGVARSSGHDKGTICKWVDLAGKHCEEVTDYFLRDLHLDRVQVDEIWSYIKKAKEYHESRS